MDSQIAALSLTVSSNSFCNQFLSFFFAFFFFSSAYQFQCQKGSLPLVLLRYHFCSQIPTYMGISIILYSKAQILKLSTQGELQEVSLSSKAVLNSRPNKKGPGTSRGAHASTNLCPSSPGRICVHWQGQTGKQHSRSYLQTSFTYKDEQVKECACIHHQSFLDHHLENFPPFSFLFMNYSLRL